MYNMYVYWTYLPTSLPTIYVNYMCSLPSNRLKTQFLSFTVHDLRQKSEYQQGRDDSGTNRVVLIIPNMW